MKTLLKSLTAIMILATQALYAQSSHSGVAVVYKADNFGYCVEFTPSGRRIGFVDETLCHPTGLVQRIFDRDNFGYCVEFTASGRRLGFVDDTECCY